MPPWAKDDYKNIQLWFSHCVTSQQALVEVGAWIRGTIADKKAQQLFTVSDE